MIARGRNFATAVGISFIALSTLTTPGISAPPPAEVTRIAFGSCTRQDIAQPYWDPLLRFDPQVWLWTGDTIYADSPRPPGATAEAQSDVVLQRMPELYAAQSAVLGYRLLQQRTWVYGTWDDHDYGANDGGADFPGEVIARWHFYDFYNEPADSALRQRKGVYRAFTFGPSGQRVQIILLDTRTFRSELKHVPASEDDREAWIEGHPGYFATNIDAEATMLGETQWQWFEEQLRAPAEVRLIVSSVQLLADDHRFEKWGNFPAERTRFLALLRDTQAQGVVVVSGDRHSAELSCLTPAIARTEGLPVLAYPLYDLTSSALSNSRPTTFASQLDGWSDVSAVSFRNEVNRYRIGSQLRYNNYGTLQIDWQTTAGPKLTLSLWTDRGDEVLRQRLPLAALK